MWVWGKGGNFADKSKPTDMKKLLLSIAISICTAVSALPVEQFVLFQPQGDAMCLTAQKGDIVYDQQDWKGVHIAIDNLKKDLEKVKQL